MPEAAGVETVMSCSAQKVADASKLIDRKE
jgi:hypothetical protein